jgi:LysR family transcriptional regulator of gallate degradation
VESGDLAVVRQLLAHSELLTACSAHQLHVEIASGAIVPLVVDLGDTRRHIGITQRLGSSASPAIEALLEEIRQLCADLPDEAMAA